MRAMLVLAAVLSFATPHVGAWSPMALAHDVSGTMSLATPAPAAKVVRAATAKADKVVGSGFAIAADRRALFPVFVAIDCAIAADAAPPHLDLNAPPLAARPPPAL